MTGLPPVPAEEMGGPPAKPEGSTSANKTPFTGDEEGIGVQIFVSGSELKNLDYFTVSDP